MPIVHVNASVFNENKSPFPPASPNVSHVELLSEIRKSMTASRLMSLFERIFLFSGSPVELSLNLSILYCWFMR